MTSNFNKLQTPLNLLDFMHETIAYGFVDKNGKKYIDQFEEWYSKYIVQSGDQLLISKCGTCWDQVELERKWFQEHNYEFKTIFSWFGIPEPSEYPTHSFLAFKENDKWNWFENSFNAYRGIHKFDELNELIEYVKSKQLQFAIDTGVAKQIDKNMISHYIYEQPKANLDVDGYTGQIIKKYSINLDINEDAFN